MNFYKNIEVARKYNVSIDTVANWITGSLENKNKLQIYFQNGRNYVVNNATNNLLLELLSENAKKYRNNKSARKIVPQESFYKTFTENHIIDIATSLEESREIPYKYYNIGKGAVYWDEYVQRLLAGGETSSIKRTIEAFDQNKEYIYSLLRDFDKVNVIDIGVGNGMHIRSLLEFLLSKKLLRKYIGIDISKDMHNIASQNYKKWFGENFPYESYCFDINYDLFQYHAIANTNIPESKERIVNLITYVGSCIENQKEYERSLQIIRDSIGINDIFVLGHILDNKAMRAHLYFNEKEKVLNGDLEIMTYLLELLNITPDIYELYRHYDNLENARIIAIKLKVDVYLKITTSSYQKTIRLNAKDEIKIFRHNHHTSYEAIDIFHKMNFDLLHANISQDGNQIMLISRKSRL